MKTCIYCFVYSKDKMNSLHVLGVFEYASQSLHLNITKMGSKQSFCIYEIDNISFSYDKLMGVDIIRSKDGEYVNKII